MGGARRMGARGAGQPALAAALRHAAGGGRALAGPRLALRRLDVGGHRVAVAVGGRGVPLVLASGLLPTARLYLQTLSRLAAMGFGVVAVDLAAGSALHDQLALDDHGRLLGRVLDRLGVRRAVLAGHSLGGRVAVELAAAQPRRAVALLLVDGGVGAPWDGLVRLLGLAPPSLGILGTMLLADTLGTIPLARDAEQAAKLSRLAAPVALAHLGAPWRLLGPGLSALRAPASAPLLDRIRRAGVPVTVIHGECDPVVPLAAAADAARRTAGELVVVHGATHSWPLQDPETLPAITAELLAGRLGAACARALADAGLDPAAATAEQLAAAFLEPGALLAQLAPPAPAAPQAARAPRRPHYRWSFTSAPAAGAIAPARAAL